MKHKEIPKGVRDLLPAEMVARRQSEQQALNLWRGHGYEEVSTPMFEFLDVIAAGGGKLKEELFLFMDREGGILSLRPELTIPIARMAATHLREAPFPQRLCYSANVFRHVLPQKAQRREFWQMGIELLGARGSLADAEVISLAVRTLQELGLHHFQISLNQIDIFNGLLEHPALPPAQGETIRRLVESKDMVALRQLLESLPLPDAWKESIARLPVLHGDLKVLDRIPWLQHSPRALRAANDLSELYEKLAIFGVRDHIVIDMGVLRGLDYYTGVVFEGYSSELGYGLLGGGRYDHLLGQFGFECPATGFAIGMDRLHMVLPTFAPAKRYLLGGEDLAAVLQRAEALRAQGQIVAIALENQEPELLRRRAAEIPGCELIYMHSDEGGR